MKTLKKIFPKALCLILAVIILFYAIPGNIYADTVDALTFESSSEEATASVSGSGTAYTYEGQAYEVEALREPSVKHFHLKDGTYVAAQYEYPVHEVDESGALVDIDNELISSGNVFQNKNSRIKFAKKTTGNGTLFTLHDGSTKISFSLNGAAVGVAGSVTNGSDAEEETELQKMMNLEKLSASIIYREVLPGVDLEYIASSRNIKENIIVKERSDSYSYSFELALNGLSAALSPGGDIVIKNSKTDATQYVIPSPVVFDANGEYAADEHSSYILADNGNGKYTLYVTVSSEWMNSEERAFPVTVDPTVLSSNSLAVDTVISELNPSIEFSDNDSLLISQGRIGYWKVNALPTLPASSTILSADLMMIDADTSNSGPILAYEVLTQWYENMTWEDHIAETSPQGTLSNDPFDYSTAESGFYSWNLMPIIEKWYSENNFGVALANFPDDFSYNSLHSSETIDIEYRPGLVIGYRNNRGLESYWSYSSHSAGVAGTGSVNLATGNLTLVVPTLSTTDNLMPYTPTLIYNSSLAKKAYSYGNTETAYATSYMGLGFKLNIGETVIEKNLTVGDSTQRYFIYDDADGTQHTFYESEQEGRYLDEDGLQKVLTVAEDGSISITDDSKQVKTFAKMSETPNTSVKGAWYLTKITDVAGNAVVFGFDSSYRPTKVSVKPINYDAIEFLNISYYTSGKLKMIYNPSSRDAVIFRYSGTYNGAISTSETKYLRQIDFACGGTSVTNANWEAFINSATNTTNISVKVSASYTYNLNGYITEAIDNTAGQKINYLYIYGKVNAVRQLAGTALGGYESYNYQTGYTELYSTGTDDKMNTSDDIVTRYVFDSLKRCVSVYSFPKAGSEIYGATVGKYETQENIKNNLKEQTVLGGSPVNYLLNGDFEENSDYYSTEFWTMTGSVYCPDLPFGENGRYHMWFEIGYGSSGAISQTVSLGAGTYTLTVPYSAGGSEGISGSVVISSVTGAAFNHAEQFMLDEHGFPTSVPALSTTFTLTSADRVSITISFSADTEVQQFVDIFVDNVMLSKSIGSTKFGFVEYGDFDMISTTTAEQADVSPYWVPSENYPGVTEDSAPISIVEDVSPFGKAVKVDAVLEKENFVKQRIYEINDFEKSFFEEGSDMFANACETDYLVSGYAQAAGAISHSNSAFRIRVDVIYYVYENNSGRYETVSHNFDFVPNCIGWQFTGGSFSTEHSEYDCVYAIDLYCEFSNQVNTYALFDNISVISAEGTDVESFEYYGEEDGAKSGLLKVKANLTYKEYYEYDEDRNLTRVANNKGELTDYVYIENGLPQYSVDYTFVRGNGSLDYPIKDREPDSAIIKTPKIKNDYMYAVNGKLLRHEVYPVNSDLELLPGGEFLSTRYSYITKAGSKIFGTLKQETGPDYDIYYLYDETNGRLLARFNLDDRTGVSYTYDALGRLVEVTPATYRSTTTYNKISDAESVSYTYDANNRLSTVTTESTTYSFSYDAFGNSSAVAIGGSRIIRYVYNDRNGKLKRILYENGYAEEYEYNELDLLSLVWYNNNGTKRRAYEYEYTASGQVYKFTDHINGKATVYSYDSRDRLTGYSEYDTSDYLQDYAASVGYDDKGQLSGVRYIIGHPASTSLNYTDIRYSYYYEADGKLQGISSKRGDLYFDEIYTYDYFDRASGKTYKNRTSSSSTPTYENTVGYTYEVNVTEGVNRVKTYTSTVNGVTVTQTFTYDDKGNIEKIVYSTGEEIRYVYDKLGQLIREDNSIRGETYVYEYDNAGNIVQYNIFDLTDAEDTPNVNYALDRITYRYMSSKSGDILTSFDDRPTITYDEIGNPIEYNNGSSYIFTWSGRQLTGAVKGDKTMSFTYNDEGIRTSKTVNGVTTTYYLNGSQIVAEETSGNLTLYIYDSEGLPIGMQYRGASYASGVWDVYYFERNIFGDIVALYDQNGTKLVSYSYDAWGRQTVTYTNNGASTTAANNPFRYRGYYFDADLGMYYLNARYYDQNTGRFISADSLGYLGANGDLNSFNLYAYCSNNPVMYADPSGNAVVALIAAFAIGFIFGGIYGGVSAAANDQDVLGGVLIGAITGGVTGFVVEAASIPVMLFLTFSVGAFGDAVSQVFLDGKSWGEVNLISSAFAGITNALLSLPGKGISKIGQMEELSLFESVIFGSMTNSPLLALGMAINVGFSSQNSMVYTAKDLVEDIVNLFNLLLEG